ncbi:MAG TPA: Rieske (2Fe-2S) protein [Gemmatimonadaceae bacterium]
MPPTNEAMNATTTETPLASCEECKVRRADSDIALNRAPVDRREFVTRSAIAAVGALLFDACGGGSNATGPGGTPGGSGTLTVQVPSYPALASVGGIARVDSGQGTPVAAVRTSSTTFSAFSLICPHFGCTVGIATGSFACPCHGARFATNGQWTGGQPTGNLTALTTSYDAANGVLTITT